jgi:hypothetical protein
VLFLVLTVAALAFLSWRGLERRFQTVGEYRNFAGDGWQYFHLAENLHNDFRFAFGPAPVPLAWSRLPGYPLFLAAFGHLADKFASDGVSFHVARAQSVLDILTALLAFLIAREIGLRGAPWLGLALCLASPLLALSCCYILTETLSTLLATATLLLLLRACRRRMRLHLAAAGALLGIGMMVRADAITMAPCFLVPLVFAPRTRRIKMEATVMAVVAAATVVAPWLIRNFVHFRHFHPTGAEWVTKQGDALPTGVQSWARTWVVDAHEASLIAWPLTKGQVVPPTALVPSSYDSPKERAALVKLVDEYNKSLWITPSVNEGFLALARERRANDRFRYFVTLPLKRAKAMWMEPVPDWEMPATSKTLALPELRGDWERLGRRTLLLALAGLLVACAFRRGRPLALLAAIAAGARTVAISFAVAGGTQRYLLELLPLVLVLAAIGLAGPAELILRRLSGTLPEWPGGLRNRERKAPG